MLASHSLFRIENWESRLLSYREYSPSRQKVFGNLGFTQERIRCFDRSAAVIEHNGCINTARWHTNGLGLLTGGDDRFVKYWKLTSDFNEVELQNAELTRHRGNIFCVDFNAIDNNMIISAAADGSVRSSSLLNHNIGTTLHSSDDIIHMFYIDQDQPHVIYTAEEAGSIYRIDLRTANAELLFRHNASAYTNSPAWSNAKYSNIMSTFSGLAPVKSIIQNPTVSTPHLIVGGRGYIVSLLDLRLTNHHYLDVTAAVSTFSQFWSPMFPFNTRSKDNQSIATIEQSTSGSHPYAQREEDTVYSRYSRNHNARQFVNEVSVSGLDISKDGHRILVNFQHDQIYTFNFHTTDKEEKGCEGVTAMIGGHINYATFLKSVRFFGPHDEYVVAGCDSGHGWIWESQHRACPGISDSTHDVYVCPVVNVLKADNRTCNGCIPHPYEPLLLSYGIDDTAKLWGFIGQDCDANEDEASVGNIKTQLTREAYPHCQYSNSNSRSGRNCQRYSLPLLGYNRSISPYSVIYNLPEILEANLMEADIALPMVFELKNHPTSRCVINPWDFKNTVDKLRWWQYYNHVLLPMRSEITSVDGAVKEVFDCDEGTFMPSDQLNHLLMLEKLSTKFVTDIHHHMVAIISATGDKDNISAACMLLSERMTLIHNYRSEARKASGMDPYIYINSRKMNSKRNKLFHYLFMPLLEMSRLAELYKTLGNTAFKAKKHDIAHFFYRKAQRYIDYIFQLRFVESKVLEGDRKLLTAPGVSGREIRSRWLRSDPAPTLPPLYNPLTNNGDDLDSDDGDEAVGGHRDDDSDIDESALMVSPQVLTQLQEWLERRKAQHADTDKETGYEDRGESLIKNKLKQTENGLPSESHVLMEEIIEEPECGQKLQEFAFVIMQTMHNQHLPELMLSVMSNLAAVFMAMEKYQEAVHVCSDAIAFAERASQPVDAKIYFHRGSAAMQLHCYEDAVTDLTQASTLCPQDKAITAKLKDARRLTDAKRKREMKVYSRMFS